MANENKINEQQPDEVQAESNVERDRDHGNMNNGTIGGNMGTIGNNNSENEAENPKKSSQGGPGTVAGDNGGGGSGNSSLGGAN
jgi:hypothetical protein